MLNKKQNRIISSFTLGYFLCLVNERLSNCNEHQPYLSEKIYLLYNQEIISAIQNLYFDLFGEFCLIEENPKYCSEFFELLKNLYEKIKEKNHWGDDSFLETAFLSGSFLCIIEAFDCDQFNLSFFEEILTKLLSAININLDHKQFSETVTRIRSNDMNDRINSRDEIFYMITRSEANHSKIVDIQNYIEHPAILQSIGLA